jgi:hypothetical protein
LPRSCRFRHNPTHGCDLSKIRFARRYWPPVTKRSNDGPWYSAPHPRPPHPQIPAPRAAPRPAGRPRGGLPRMGVAGAPEFFPWHKRTREGSWPSRAISGTYVFKGQWDRHDKPSICRTHRGIGRMRPGNSPEHARWIDNTANHPTAFRLELFRSYIVTFGQFSAKRCDSTTGSHPRHACGTRHCRPTAPRSDPGGRKSNSPRCISTTPSASTSGRKPSSS